MKTGIAGIQKKVEVNHIKLIPNPAKDLVNIDLSNFPKSSQIIECTIFNNEGKWIRNYKIPANTSSYEIDLSGFSGGLYHLSFNDGLSYSTNKLMINK
jgi:hypothetical protein